MTSSIPFPASGHATRTSGSKSTVTNMSVMSRHATALEVCDFVYGDSMEMHGTLDDLDRFYEASANIYALSRQLSQVDVPRPLAMLCTLFGMKPPDTTLSENGDTLFQALRIWTEIGDISESESFDGHHKNIIEHTLNVLLLPGLHRDRHAPKRHARGNDSPSNLSVSTRSSTPLLPLPPLYQHYLYQHQHPTHLVAPGIAVPGTNLTLPSPFHGRMHIITRLSFNEQGRITHHRDFWDVKDLLGLIPGASLAQWVGSRLAARGISTAARLLLGIVGAGGSGAVEPGTGAAVLSSAGRSRSRSRSGSVGYGMGGGSGVGAGAAVPSDMGREGTQQEDIESARGLVWDRPQLNSAAGYGAYVMNAMSLHNVTTPR